MEFIPSPIRFASDIFSRVKAVPSNLMGRLSGAGSNLRFLKNTALPGLKNIGVKGSLKGVAKAAPITSQLYGAYEGTRRLIGGQDPHQVALGYGYALPGPWGWGNFAADVAEQSGVLGGGSRMAGDTSIGSGGFLAPAGYELQGDYTNLSATPPGGNGDIYAGNQGGWVNAPVDYELQGDYTNLPTTPPGGNGAIYEGDPVVIDDGGRQAWLDKTANSPAARAGVFSDDERWALHLKDSDYQQARKTGTLDEFAEKYPNSQTAKKRNWNPRMGRRF